jgi:hypothetical protein
MEKIAALLLHPDPQARATLRDYLAGVDFIRVVGETVTAFEAGELLRAIPYGIVFLGVDLPGGISGLDLAKTPWAARTGRAWCFWPRTSPTPLPPSNSGPRTICCGRPPGNASSGPSNA